MVFGGSLHAPAAPAGTQAPPSESPAATAPAETAAPLVTPEPTPEPTPQTFTISFIGDITPDSVPFYRG